jgi:hypothetical protein
MNPRRQLLKFIPLSGLATLSRWTVAQDAAKAVTESEPQAQSLGYVTDASRADKARFPKYAPPQHCGTCQFYQAAATAPSGPCTLFAGRSVAGPGWCSAYVAKTA